MAVSEDQNQHETNHTVDEGELEQYGVWVKAGPEDVIEAEAEDEAFSLSDLGDESFDVESELSSVSGERLEPMDLESLEEIPDTELPEASEETLETVLEDRLEEISFGEEEEAVATADEAMLTLEEEDLTFDLAEEETAARSLEEVPEMPLETGEEPEDLGELELEELGLEDFGEDEAAGPVRSEPEGGDIVDGDLNIEEELPDNLDDLTLDLDDLDVDAFEEPTTGAPEEPEGDLEAEILEEASPLEDLGEAGPEEEELDLASLSAGEDEFGELAPEELGQEEEELPELEGEEELILEDDFAAGEAGEEALAELTLDEGFEEPLAEEEPAAATEDLLELDEEPEGDLLEEIDIEDELLDLTPSEGAPETRAPEPPAPVAPSKPAAPARAAASAAGDRSLSLLESIERELASIRDELGDLKRELGELRVQPAPAPALQATAEEAAGGFFEGSEDEDETIALTGAELDNIMNTAEFTEETGKPTEVDDLIGPVSEDILGEEEPSLIGGISLEEAPEENDSLDIDLESTSDEILAGSEEGVEALASMDIDAELADIEELQDTSEDFAVAAEEELADFDFDAADLSADSGEPVLDAEPLDEPELPQDIVMSRPIPPTVEAETELPDNLKSELRSVLSYMDQLLESLPEEKIQEFARSEHFTVYRRLFEELGLEQ